MKLCNVVLELAFVFEADGSLSSQLHSNFLVFPNTQIHLSDKFMSEQMQDKAAL